jgi:hypothetical protein
MFARYVLVLLLALPALAGAADFPAGSACALLGAGDIVDEYRRLAELPTAALAGLAGQGFTLQVDDPAEDRRDIERLPDGRVRLVYRMGRNDVTEGWNWHPEADLQREDYYRYKYLPLGQRETEIAPPRVEPDPAYGDFRVTYRRRDAYYFAFDNPYDFYPRNDADDGFAIEVAEASLSRFHLLAHGRFAAPWRAESSTYWRAIPAQPVDLWMKNRYFMGRLETLWFCSDDGRILGRADRIGR